MTNSRNKKITVKKRTLRRLDPESLDQAKGGTFVPWTENCPPPGLTDFCEWSFAWGGGRGNHNQRLAR